MFFLLSLWKQLKKIVGQTWPNLVTLIVDHEVKVCIAYISRSSDIALYLEDNLIYDQHSLGL